MTGRWVPLIQGRCDEDSFSMPWRHLDMMYGIWSPECGKVTCSCKQQSHISIKKCFVYRKPTVWTTFLVKSYLTTLLNGHFVAHRLHFRQLNFFIKTKIDIFFWNLNIETRDVSFEYYVSWSSIELLQIICIRLIATSHYLNQCWNCWLDSSGQIWVIFQSK